MSKRTLWIASAAALAAATLAAGYWLGTRAAVAPAEKAATADSAGGASGKERKLLYYRNPMGLPDTSPVPKKDPMGMDYIPVYEGDTPQQGLPPGTVRVSPDKVQVLGVRTEAAAAREMRRAVQAVGTIQANERLLYKVAPRFEGWVDKLHVNTTGQAVARGQPLMDVYSPELITAQEEYLIALRGVQQTGQSSPEAQASMRRLADAALRRLRNWEISDRDLEALRGGAEPRRTLTYRSAVDGVVLQKPALQGMRFMPGEALFEIANLSSVWAIAEVFEQDLALVHVGQQATLRLVSYPERAFTGKVVFVYPTMEAETRTARVRIELVNPGGILKPAMYGNVELASGHPGGKVLAVPDSAVLDSGDRRLVLVARGEGLFEPREVRTGMRGDGYLEVLEGLSAGENVVVRANFLIDAESNLKSALGGFGGHGGGHGGAAKPAAGKGDAPSAAAGREYTGKGTVEGVDRAGGSVEIAHGPIESLGWPAMTMQFKLKDKTALARLSKGQAVEFSLVPDGPGEYAIGRIAPAAPAAHGGGHGG